MSRENVEFVRQIYEGIHRIGPGGLVELPDAALRAFFDRAFDPELEVRQNPNAVFDTGGTFRGYEGYLEAARELQEAFSKIRFEPGRAFAAGHFVVFDVVAHATGKESGIATEVPVAHLWQFKDGRVLRWIVYMTLDEALKAAGLSEQDAC